MYAAVNGRRAYLLDAAIKAGLKYSVASPAPGLLTCAAIDCGLLILSRYPIVESNF